MLIKSQTGLVAVRRRLVAPRFGHPVCNALSDGMTIGFAAAGALACHPKVDDFSHAKPQRLRFAHGAFGESPLHCRIRINCADTVARITGEVLRCAITHNSMSQSIIAYAFAANDAGQ
jgi:hypothetical protein